MRVQNSKNKYIHILHFFLDKKTKQKNQEAYRKFFACFLGKHQKTADKSSLHALSAKLTHFREIYSYF